MSEQATEMVQTEVNEVAPDDLHVLRVASKLIVDNTDRMLHAFRELLNLENEAMTVLRDIRRERDNDRIDAAEKDFTLLLFDLMKYTHSPEFIKDYFGRLGLEQLRMIGNAFDALLSEVATQVKTRAEAIIASAKLAMEDDKKGN